VSVPVVQVSGTDQVLQLRRDLLKVPQEAQRGLRRAVREIGSDVQQTSQANASWSSRIPGAHFMRVSLSQSRPGVFIRVDHNKAPHARPYEGILQWTFRHPVYGDRENWVEQQSRPYLVPALESNEGQAFTAIRSTVDEVLSKLGL